jgi:predicted DNA-binding transcriptional regulator YafY
MLSVLWLMQSRKRITAADIAQELEISIRTVYRYVDALCMSGVPIISDSGHDGGFRLAENFRRTPLFFELSESKAMFHAAQFARRAGYPFNEPLDTALAKLAQNSSPGHLEYLERHTDSFDVVSPPRGGEVGDWLVRLEEAVAERETLHVLYHKALGGEPEWRKVDPYGLAFDSGLWYLAVFCHERLAMRDFRVDRIMDVRKLGEHFQRPADFSVVEFFSNQEMVRDIQTGPFTIVVIRGIGWALQSICDHWYMRYCVQERGREQLALNVNAVSAKQIPAMLLAYGTEIEIIEPDSFRQSLSELALIWANHHSLNSKLS